MVTITYRIEANRHRAIKQTALENDTSIQAIIDYALAQIGL
jgi:hypothetical protein